MSGCLLRNKWLQRDIYYLNIESEEIELVRKIFFRFNTTCSVVVYPLSICYHRQPEKDAFEKRAFKYIVTFWKYAFLCCINNLAKHFIYTDDRVFYFMVV